jgi:hypothetical protein
MYHSHADPILAGRYRKILEYRLQFLSYIFEQGAEGSFDFLALVVADLRKEIEELQATVIYIKAFYME